MSSPLLSLAAFAARLLPMPLRRLAYRLGPLTRLIRQSLSRAAPSGLTETVIAAGDLRGSRMLLDLQTEKDLWLGTYEPSLQAALHDFAFPGAIAYDVGAHIGYVSLLLARAIAPDGQVFAFEPLPANLERLRHHVERNDLSTRVHIFPAAVTDRTGRAQFLVHPSGAMGKVEGSAGRAEAYRQSIDVECLALDDFVFIQGNPVPDLIKMDVEGGEVRALIGTSRLLSEGHPLFLIELHGPEACADARQLLTSHGYRLHHLRAGYPAIATSEDLPWKAYVLALPPNFAGKGR